MAAITMNEMRDQILARSVEDEDFRAQLIADPKSVISQEFGISVPDGFSIQVHEDNATTAHVILPRPARLTEEDLAMVTAGGDWLDGASDFGEGGP